MRCTSRCPAWYFSLRFPTGLGPICRRFMLPLDAAREKCFAVGEPGRARKKKIPAAKPIQANPWPGALRGCGAITR